MDDLTLAWHLTLAYITNHGQLLCGVCVEHNRHQLTRAGITLEPVPCHGIVVCTLCDRSVSDLVA